MNLRPLDASVLIPSYNNREALLLCLSHLARQSYPFDRFEAIVVVDGSTDGSYEALRAATTPYRLTVIEQPNQGRAAALNRAAQEARAELLIVIDSDILCHPRFVASHIKAHEAADVVIGPIPLADRSPANFLTDGVRKWADEHAASMARHHGPFRCTEIYGANLSIGRELFWKLGGYRADLRRTEDFQLGKKILAANCRVAYCAEAIAEHVYDKSFFAWCADFYQDGRSHYRFVREYPDETLNLRIGRYHPSSITKRLLRPIVRSPRPAGRAVVRTLQTALETCRRLGLRWRILSSCQGVLGDAFFWKGVHDEIDDRQRFHALIHHRRVD